MIRFSLIILGTLYPSFLFAQGVSLTDLGFDCRGFVGCGEGNLVSFFIARVLSLILPTFNGMGFIFYVSVAAFLWGALQMTLSRGEDMKESGKNAMLYACAGFALALLTSGILSFICSYLYTLGGTASSFCFQIWGQ